MPVQLIGRSPAFKRVLEAVALVAPVDTGVLILGETGTGKELIARAIHEAGPRRRRPFVAVNCAAIPTGLLETELFGHERGAFTGAVAHAIGRFQAADGGTLFLDEVGDLPAELQPKLLRVLQERQIERLGGGGRVLPVDVRVIAATNQDLWEMVQKREFRADLYYRLNIFPVLIPPLRARAEDFGPLVAHFVQQFGARHGKLIHEVPDALIEALRSQTWPGNIRELQNVIERAVIQSPGAVLCLPSNDTPAHEPVRSWRTLAEVERDHIVATLHESNGIIGGWNGAAARLGLSRTTLLARLQRLGIARDSTGTARAAGDHAAAASRRRAADGPSGDGRRLVSA